MTLKARSALPALVLVATLLGAASAAADEIVAEIARDSPIAAYGGAVAWSQYDAAIRRYRLVVRRNDVAAVAPIAAATRAFDVSLGPDARGRLVALYTRCRTATRGCDVYRYEVKGRRERRLVSVSSPVHDEAWPVQWGDRVAFVRRARAHALGTGNDVSSQHPPLDLFRPDPRGGAGGGSRVACDVPYVKTMSSRVAPRRLDRGLCAETTGLSIRGDNIVQVTDIPVANVVFAESQVRRLSARGGPMRVLARSLDYGGIYSPFASPTQSASAVWLTRNRIQRPRRDANDFLRIDLASRRLTKVRPHLLLAGRVARDERGTFWYVQRPEANDLDAHDANGRPPFCTARLERCRLVRASASPFSRRERTLLPSLRRARAGFSVLWTDPPVRIAGDLTRPVVRGGTVVRREPLPNVAVELLTRGHSEIRGPHWLAATGLATTTDAAGRWSFMVGQGPPEAVYAARAPALRTLSAATSVGTRSVLTLSAAGMTLTGTAAPAQPGRLIDIEFLSSDSAGRMEHGCDPNLVSGERACTDWTPVRTVPLDAAGTAFSATLSRPGTYRATLSIDGPEVELSYFGTSRAVRVGS